MDHGAFCGRHGWLALKGKDLTQYCPGNALCVAITHACAAQKSLDVFFCWQASAPRSTAEALRSPHGRPAVPLVAFGFGGRVVALQLSSAPSMGAVMSLGSLSLMPLAGAISCFADRSQFGSQTVRQLDPNRGQVLKWNGICKQSCMVMRPVIV